MDNNKNSYVKHPSYDGMLEPNDNRVEEYKKDYDTRGFDDSVTWSLDYSLIHWLTPRLRRFLEISKNTTQADDLHKDIEAILVVFEEYCKEEFDSFDREKRKSLDKAFKILSKTYSGLWW